MWGICSVSSVLRKWAFLGGPGLGWAGLNKKWLPGTPFLVQSIDGFQWQKSWRASQKEADLKSVKLKVFGPGNRGILYAMASRKVDQK
jgi:hypothetical protein